jgi:hypothetical protein
MVGESEVGLGLGPVRAVVAGASALGAAAAVEGQARDGVQGGDGAVMGVVKVQAMTALRAVRQDGLERRGRDRAGAGLGAWQEAILLSWSLPLLRSGG